MSCQTRKNPRLTPRLFLDQPRGALGFTLIELLTVITIIAILATLLLTTLSSVKRKAREAVCTSNLHQIGLALHLYLEDFGKRPPDLQTLASAKYVGGAKILTCPADRTGLLLASSQGSDSRSVNNSAPSVHVSYQHPLGWPDEQWNRLMLASTRAGVVVCPFHDIRSPVVPFDTTTSEGLILRGHLDGSVVRRQIFRRDSQAITGSPLAPTDKANGGTASFAADPNNTTLGSTNPPWDLFSDDP
jgi:prepilin-type N-terminal cleavage/methylation domain-containing protein